MKSTKRNIGWAFLAGTIALAGALFLHWILWKLWVQRYDVSPSEDLSIELAVAASISGFLALAVTVGLGWFVIIEFIESTKPDKLSLHVTDEGDGDVVQLRASGDSDTLELNVFVRNDGDSIASVFGFELTIPFLAKAHSFHEIVPAWGNLNSDNFGRKVIVGTGSAREKNIQLRVRDGLHSIQYSNSNDFSVFPAQRFLLFSIVVPAEAFKYDDYNVPAFECQYTLYSLNGEPRKGTFKVSLVCSQNQAMHLAELRRLRKYPRIAPSISAPVIIDEHPYPEGDEKRGPCCVFTIRLENKSSIPLQGFSFEMSTPFLEDIWPAFRARYGLPDDIGGRTKMFGTLGHPNGRKPSDWSFYADSDLDSNTNLLLELTSANSIVIRPGERYTINRFDIPTEFIPAIQSHTCQYRLTYSDGEFRDGEMSMYIANRRDDTLTTDAAIDEATGRR